MKLHNWQFTPLVTVLVNPYFGVMGARFIHGVRWFGKLSYFVDEH